MARNTILVVGNTTTPADLEDLTAFAFDVADRIQLPAEVATSMAYDVTAYAGVVLYDTWLDSVPSAVLGTEALEADMFAIGADELYAYEPTKTCGHCGEVDDEAAPVLRGNTWTVSVCPSCVAEAARVALPGAPLVAAA
ncbi:hypothetical protein [Streptomyces sp. NBC_00986]|uniref:hypothetical protein n=1 Tax=Streptomyces sp. NBC_00986 TaxID=2903702 RepID=UPI0038643213|nr:hypothetical protein OG504_42775 [Streptomyces sp. NBC_00986]